MPLWNLTSLEGNIWPSLYFMGFFFFSVASQLALERVFCYQLEIGNFVVRAQVTKM